MDAETKAMLVRMPLAEAVLWLWRWLTAEDRLVRLWEAHRGRCYARRIPFPLIVQLMVDALLQCHGSGRRSFERGIEAGQLPASIQAAYAKLGRLPLPLSEAILADGAAALQTILPPAVSRKLPRSLNRFQVIVLDRATIAKLAKRLLPLPPAASGQLGGRALVASEWRTGLAVAMRGYSGGDAKEVGLVGALMPEVRSIISGPRLWIAEQAFCDLAKSAHFQEQGDHYLVRHHPKIEFHLDPERQERTGEDPEGREYAEQWGWLGGPQDPRRQEVRMITLHKAIGGKQDLVLVTDLLDGDAYPAADLLDLYSGPGGIEEMFRQVTQVFALQGLIGCKPPGVLFQFAFCLLLYDFIQVIRSYVAEAEQRDIDEISIEKLATRCSAGERQPANSL